MIDLELEIIDKNITKLIREVLPEGQLISFLNNGSKRIRTRLALNYIKALDKLPDNNIYDILTVGELIHNASLLHDDVIDDAELRRGNTTIGKLFSQNISILCGDYLVSEAVETLLQINNIDISRKFNNCVKNMAIAEIKQYFLRNSIPKKEDYLEICKGKTAGLFETILWSCAKYFNLNCEEAANFGTIFGIAFQIKNDFDKISVVEDKKNNIHTAADILGIENAKILLDNYKEELENTLHRFPDNKYKTSLKELVNKL